MGTAVDESCGQSVQGIEACDSQPYEPERMRCASDSRVWAMSPTQENQA